MYVGEFAAAVGIDTATNYNLLVDRLAPVERQVGSLAVGVLMSEKTGLLGIPNRHGSVYPPFNEVEAMAAAQANHPNPLELIVHYNTDHTDVVAGQLVRALAPIAPNVNGVQINGLGFNDVPQLERLKEAYGHLAIMMQINSDLLSQYSAAELVEMVNRSKCIDGVWLDPSGGLDVQLSPADLLPYIQALTDDTDASIGMGGGLNPQTLRRLLEPVLSEHPGISWDGQSGVQTEVDGQKHFDVDKAYDFLAISADLRREYPPHEFQQ
jgi:hypothetical protein